MLAAVALLAAFGVAVLVVSRNAGLTAEIVGSAVGVCGFAWSVAIFVLPRLREPVGTLDTAKVAALPAVVPTGLLPSIVRDRDYELGQLRRRLRRLPGEFVVLTGMGGVGKSTIACTFAERVERTRVRWRHADVWFVSAADPSSLAGALATVARDLGAPDGDIEAVGMGRPDAPDRLWRLLHNARRKWVLIFDNADDPSVLARPVAARGPQRSSGSPADGAGWVRPSRRGLVVVTSRIADPSMWGRHARIMLVRPLEEPDAIQVLLDRAPHAGDADQARPLARRLGCLPLTLKVAGSYLNADPVSGMSFRDYEIELMMTAKPELKAQASERDVPVRTFEISLNDLSRKGVPQARSLLRLLACYASPTPIPRGLFHSERLRGLLAPDGSAKPRYELEQGLQELMHHSLIEFQQADVVVHPVIADACRAHLQADDGLVDAVLVRQVAVELMVGRLGDLGLERPPDVEKEPSRWPALVPYGPHLHALLGTVANQLDDLHVRDLLTAATLLAHVEIYYGAIAEAKRLAEAALDKIALLADDQADSLTTRHYLAWFLVLLRQPEKAEGLYRNVLENRERILGPSHLDTLWTRHELAWVKACRRSWPEAEADYRRVLAELVHAIGEDDPAILITRHELAWAIANQGRGEEAERLLIDVLAARRRMLGDYHLRTLQTRHELAWAIAVQGRWAEAEVMYREVLDARGSRLRADHPDTLTAMQELAWTIAAQGRHHEALELYQSILAARQAALGADDPDTQATSQAIEALQRGQITVPRHIA